VKFNLFAVELSSSASVDRLVTKVVIAGSDVSFNCTLNKSCVNQSIDWEYYSTFDMPVLWYRRGRLNPILEFSNVTVDENSARGWSVLRIAGLTFADRGIFRCSVLGLHYGCQMKFPLTVTGNV